MYNITVRARDTASNTRELEVVVTVTDVNERPDIDENFNAPQTYMEIEYDFTGTRPDVHTFTATDYDAGDTIGWALAGTDVAYLEIDPTTGVLTFSAGQRLRPGPVAQLRASSRRRRRRRQQQHLLHHRAGNRR